MCERVNLKAQPKLQTFYTENERFVKGENRSHGKGITNDTVDGNVMCQEK